LEPNVRFLYFDKNCLCSVISKSRLNKHENICDR
jgi:hypothetical protein